MGRRLERGGGEAKREGGDALNALRVAVEASRKLADKETLIVRDARKDGASWEQIGEVFGITRQSAHARFREFTKDIDGDSNLASIGKNQKIFDQLKEADAKPEPSSTVQLERNEIVDAILADVRRALISKEDNSGKDREKP